MAGGLLAGRYGAAPINRNSRVVLGCRRGHCPGARMNPSEFLRIEREGRDGSKHYVVHTQDPKFTLELVPDSAAPDQIGRGVMKRIHVPNSWAGDYTKYSNFISAAQEFFAESFGEPQPKAETRRFGIVEG
jgi:hypothetical protein